MNTSHILAAALTLGVAMANCSIFAEGVKYRGIFINDEDWNLRPWAVKHFGPEEGIGTNVYAMVYDLMQRNGLNAIWPAMHEGRNGYEFCTRPENMEQAKAAGITVGTSHCESMLRNNAYLPRDFRVNGGWNWLTNRTFIANYWKEMTDKYRDYPVLWTVGMRGIHDSGMGVGTNLQHKIEILEDVFAYQYSLLPKEATKVFVPYKEVLGIYNAGLTVPNDGHTIIMWTNDNYGYVRRVGTAREKDCGQGMYYHISYHGAPRSYLQLCTTAPALMWYELVAKCWNNGVRDEWIINAGDVFQAEPLLHVLGRFANEPESYGPDAQDKVLESYLLANFPSLQQAKPEGIARVLKHLNDYYALAFIRKPEFMTQRWADSLPADLKASLDRRYDALLKEELEIEKLMPEEEYFRQIGFHVQFFAKAGLLFMRGYDRAWAQQEFDALNQKFHTIEGGKWDGFWTDTVTERSMRKDISKGNGGSSLMNWPWNEPKDPEYIKKREKEYLSRCTQYRPDERIIWTDGAAFSATAKADDGGAWVSVKGLGTSGRAMALLPVKADSGKGASLAYTVTAKEKSSLMLQFLPTYELFPEAGISVEVVVDGGTSVKVPVPVSYSTIPREQRYAAISDGFIRTLVPGIELAPGVHEIKVIADGTAGVVLDKIGLVYELGKRTRRN